ncbi:MAG: AMP-binding protein, partial [bacterium]
MHKNTIIELFLSHIEKNNSDKEIFYTKDKDKYIPFTIRELILQIYLLVKFFRELKLISGDKIAIFSESRIEWVAVDFACMFCRLITIPIYTSQSNSQIKYILENSETKLCFVSNQLLLDKISGVKGELPEMKQIIIFNELIKKDSNEELIKNFGEIISSEKQLSEKEI